MRILAIIPARLNSTRLAEKPLININGKSMIQRVYEQVKKCEDINDIIIATDDIKIYNHVESFKGSVIMTNNKHLSGTERCNEANKKLKKKYDIIINVQGDEPIFDPNDLKELIKYGLKNSSAIVSGYCEINEERMYNDLNVPKVVLDKKNYLMYASRAPIPSNKKAKFISANRQICAYSFPKETLKIFSSYKKKAYLESIEDIEYLRFLEIGIKVKCIKMSGKSLAIDNSYDLNVVTQIIKKNEKIYA
jgi:3-deoxy-manno-octulosonate cytidylyltransferase (CMP-KDO synthetase)